MAIPNYCLKDAQGYPLKDAQGYPRKSTATCESCCGGGIPDPGCCPSSGGDIARNCGVVYGCVLEFHEDYLQDFGSFTLPHNTQRVVTDLVSPSSLPRTFTSQCVAGVSAHVASVTTAFNRNNGQTTTTNNDFPNQAMGPIPCCGITSGTKATKIPSSLPFLSGNTSLDYPLFLALDSGGSQVSGSITQHVDYSWSVSATGEVLWNSHYYETGAIASTLQDIKRNFRLATAIAGPCGSNPTTTFPCPIPGSILTPCPGCTHQATDFREGF